MYFIKIVDNSLRLFRYDLSKLAPEHDSSSVVPVESRIKNTLDLVSNIWLHRLAILNDLFQDVKVPVAACLESPITGK